MKKLVVLFAAFIIFPALLAAQNYGLDNSDPSVFTKYRVPETNLSSLWFNANFNYLSNKSVYSVPYNDIENYSFTEQQNYLLSPRYSFLNENDDRRLFVDALIEGRYEKRLNKQQGYASIDNEQNTYNLLINLSWLYNEYFLKDNIFYSIRSNINVELEDLKENQFSQQRSNSYFNYKKQGYDFYMGIGWGKMRNITPVVSAIRFQERLKTLSLIENNLDNKTIGDLAQQFSKSNYYSQVHVRSEKYFWDAIEKTLENDGISLKGLNQYGSSFLREVPNEIRFLRNEGLVTGVNLRLKYDNLFTGGGYYSEIAEQLNIMGNAYINYSHQLNLNSQIHGDLSISGGPNMIKSPSVRQEYLIEINAGYDFELTDRIVTSINNSYNLSFQNQRTQSKRFDNNLQLLVNYFVEDNLSLNASYNWLYNETKYEDVLKQSINNNYIQFGFTYFIDRGFIH